LYSSSDYNNITHNNATSNNWYGIRLWSSSNNTVADNNASDNHNCGIYLSSSANTNNITHNTINNNRYYGIYMESSHHNDVTYNTINSTGWNGYTDSVSGIYLTAWASYNNITNNTVTHSGEGLSLGGHGYGIYLRDYPGLQDSGPHNNTIAGNNLSENRDCDMVNRRSPDNIYLNNTFSSYPTTANITAYSGNFTISGVSDPPAMPTGVENISKFLDITTEDYINVTIHYEDSDLADASNEGTMVIWKHNGSGPFNGWYYNGSWYGDRGIDTTANEIWVNITDSGSIFAPLQDTQAPTSSCTVAGP